MWFTHTQPDGLVETSESIKLDRSTWNLQTAVIPLVYYLSVSEWGLQTTRERKASVRLNLPQCRSLCMQSIESRDIRTYLFFYCCVMCPLRNTFHLPSIKDSLRLSIKFIKAHTMKAHTLRRRWLTSGVEKNKGEDRIVNWYSDCIAALRQRIIFILMIFDNNQLQ